MGNCYKFVNSPKVSWSEAHSLCADLGGTLAYLDSWIEIYWLRGYRDTYSNLQNRHWIGGYRTGGKWVWQGKTSNRAITITDWYSGEPNGGDTKECLEILGSAHNYRWNDAKCHIENSFICEKN